LLTFSLDEGVMDVSVRDASTCVNLNGLAAGAGDMLVPSETGGRQLRSLLAALDVPDLQAAELTEAITDWIDTDGDDDGAYRNLAQPYRSGAEMLAEESELRAIAGMTPELYAKIRPYVCALPFAKPARVNLNALQEEQAPVLVALSEGRIPLAAARRAIAQRPASGWSSISEFWMQDALADLQIPETAFEATGLEPAALALTVRVAHLDAEVVMSELLVLSPSGEYVPAGRRWGEAP
jgi:general secretion pathway protein K